MKARYLWGSLFAAVLASGVAYAQFTGQLPAPSQVQNLHQSDLAEIVPFGSGAAPQALSPVGTVSSMLTYTTTVPLTGFTITAPNPNIATLLVLNPAGTLATGTLTLPALPNDGGAFCIASTQAQTALTVTPNTGQTAVGSPTALTIGQTACMRYIGPLSTWIRDR